MKYAPLIALVGAIFLALWATPANAAQAPQTWVSGVGVDSNPLCTRTAPCKTFAGALSQTMPGGEVNCLDSGDFGSVTIAASVTIDCDKTSNGGVLVTGGTAITITAGIVNLRGLDISGDGGSGGTGVSIAGGATVNIQNSKIYGFGAAGVSVASGGSLILTSTRITNNGIGVLASGSSLVVGNDIIDDNSGNGITLEGNAYATIEGTTLAFNGGTGLSVSSSSATALLGNSTITGNATGISDPTQNIYSFKNNQIGGNTTDGTPLQATSLTLSVSTVGSGTVTSADGSISCGSTCSASYDVGSQITLTATAASGWSFSGWSGAACSGSGACSLTIAAGTNVIATFAQKSYALSVSEAGNGTVTSGNGNINCGSTCSASYLSGAQVTLTANPASGWGFAGWGGACSGTGGCVVTMNQAQSVSAAFTQITPPSFTLSVSETGSGTVTSADGDINCGSTCSASYLRGSQVTLTANPASGWGFAGWGGACSGTGSCVVTINAASSVSATFTLDSYTLSVGTGGGGTVTSSPAGINCGGTCGASYLSGTVVSLTETAASGFAFAGWGGACGGVGTCVVTMNQAQSVSASFAPGSPPTSPLVAAVLPASRSATVGNPVTAFATIINTGASTAPACAISPVGGLPVNFVYQTTDPNTNALTGTANTPVDIAGNNGIQTFVIALTPTAAFAPVQVPFSFACGNVPPAPSVTGLNTLLLSSSTTPVADIVALVATATNDGILHIPGSTGANAFAVATVNVGAGDTITATANTGSASLPLALSLCQTDPNSGQCTSAIGGSVSTTINANATPTFAIFGQASGAIPFDPANSRIFVQFTDPSGTVRGATSVAVETQ